MMPTDVTSTNALIQRYLQLRYHAYYWRWSLIYRTEWKKKTVGQKWAESHMHNTSSVAEY